MPRKSLRKIAMARGRFCEMGCYRLARPLFLLLIICTAAVSAASVAAAAAIAPGDTITAEVLFVFDGDSLRVRLVDPIQVEPEKSNSPPGEERDLRLWGIDAPEKNQPAADAARIALKTLLAHATVTAKIVTIDQFDRLVVTLKRGDLDVNLSQIQHGHAWWFRRFAAHATDYQAAEINASNDHLGLWSEENPEAPWAYRDRMANAEPQNP